MSDMNTPGVPGQVTDPSAAIPTTDAAEILRVVEQNTKAFLRVSDVLVKLSGRLDVLEKRVDEGDEAAPKSEERPLDPSPRLALRSDGAVLVEVTSDIDEADLIDREVRRYATLNTAETSDAVDRADAALGDVAARAGWQLARARKGYPKIDALPTEPTS